MVGISVAIIMLNTILYNPSVKDKIGVDRFIDMNRGINAGGDLPPELLTVSLLSIFTFTFDSDIWKCCFKDLVLFSSYKYICLCTDNV